MRAKYNRNSHAEPKPVTITLIGSTKERKCVVVKALTKHYVIVSLNDEEERVYEIPNGTSPTGCDWYHVSKRSLKKLKSYIKNLLHRVDL